MVWPLEDEKIARDKRVDQSRDLLGERPGLFGHTCGIFSSFFVKLDNTVEVPSGHRYPIYYKYIPVHYM
jgi:hypothetical protein